MAFKGKTMDDLIRIMSAGAGFRLDARARAMDELILIAAASKSGGGRLVLTGMSIYNTDDLMRIASAGAGHVTFEE